MNQICNVANPDITPESWLQLAFLSSHVYTLNRMLLQAKQPELRVAAQSACYNQLEFFSTFSW